MNCFDEPVQNSDQKIFFDLKNIFKNSPTIRSLFTKKPQQKWISYSKDIAFFLQNYRMKISLISKFWRQSSKELFWWAGLDFWSENFLLSQKYIQKFAHNLKFIYEKAAFKMSKWVKKYETLNQFFRTPKKLRSGYHLTSGTIICVKTYTFRNASIMRVKNVESIQKMKIWKNEIRGFNLMLYLSW